MKGTTIFLLLVASTASIGRAQQIRYVKADASGSGDGSSWVNALASLQDALAASVAGDEIWVAAGVYRPDQGSGLTPGDRSLSIGLKSGVRVHGGFAGTESSKGSRDLAANPAVLSGDLAGDDDGLVLREDNSYHVVRATGVDENTLLEGFVVVSGQADGADADSLGAGILIEGGAPWIINTRVNSNVAGCGGGIASVGGAAPTIVNLVANGNRATLGGGLCNLDSDPEIVNATVTGNTAVFGAGVYNRVSQALLTNSVVAGNRIPDERDPCAYWQYPCSLADISEIVLERSKEVMGGAWDARMNGSMNDALTHVSAQPDVIQTGLFENTLGFRIAGGTMVFLTDVSDGAPKTGEKTSVQVPGDRTIVGRDTDSNGKIDNRDSKKALILAPLDFLFGGTNASDAQFIYNVLNDIPAYGGNVTFYQNASSLDNNVLPEHYLFSEYDVVYLATTSFEYCAEAMCLSGIAAGTYDGNPPDDGTLAFFYDGFAANSSEGTIVVGTRFFKKRYADSGVRLDDALFYCAACSFPHSRDHLKIAEHIGGDNFVMMHWSERVGLVDASVANRVVMDGLANGLTILDAVQEAERQSALPVESTEGSTTIFVTPFDLDGTARMRIIELPTLLYPDTPESLTDGRDITDLVNDGAPGGIDDGEPDEIQLGLRVKGIADLSAVQDMSFRYLVDDKPVQGTYNLSNAVAGPGGTYSVFTHHDLDLGFPVMRGVLPIEVIADLPGGGESRFNVTTTVDAFDCGVRAKITGYRSGGFSGPAGFTLDGGRVHLEFGSYYFSPDGLDPQHYTSSITVGLNDAVASIGSIQYVDFVGGPWGALYIAGDENYDCEGCGGGIITVTTASNEDVLVGKVDLTATDATATDDDPRKSRLQGTFRAFRGTLLDATSPYRGCVEQYWNAIEPGGILSKK